MEVSDISKSTHVVCGWHPYHGSGILSYHDDKKSAKWKRDFLNSTGGETYVQTKDKAISNHETLQRIRRIICTIMRIPNYNL